MTDQAAYRPEAIIPPDAAPLRTLTLAMAVMCYLAVLAAGGLVLINRSVEAWTGDLSREITVQIREIQGRNMEADLEKAAAILKTTPGVLKVTVLDEKAAIDLLGDHVLMFASDYPHPETIFPDHADSVIAWREKLGESAMQKLMWENASRFLRLTSTPWSAPAPQAQRPWDIGRS